MRVMKIKNKKIYLFLLISFSALMFFRGAQANNSVNFGQSILPVKFVYIDSKGKISRIWDNVGYADSAYVLKFFSENKNKEIEINENILTEFGDRSIRYEENNLKSLSVDFFIKDNKLEEVRTFV